MLLSLGLEAGERLALFDVTFGLGDCFVHLAVVFLVDGALGQGAVYFSVALGAVEVGVAFLVELLIFSQVAELVQDGVEAGLEAVVDG